MKQVCKRKLTPALEHLKSMHINHTGQTTLTISSRSRYSSDPYITFSCIQYDSHTYCWYLSTAATEAEFHLEKRFGFSFSVGYYFCV